MTKLKKKTLELFVLLLEAGIIQTNVQREKFNQLAILSTESYTSINSNYFLTQKKTFRKQH